MPRYYTKQQGKNTLQQNGRTEKSKPFFVLLSLNFRETKFNRDRLFLGHEEDLNGFVRVVFVCRVLPRRSMRCDAMRCTD